MKKTVISGAVAALLSVPAMAQNAGSMEQDLQRLQAEVDYLKQEIKAQRKEAAEEDIVNAAQDTKISAASKFSWSGDFRYRSEHITTATNAATPEQTRNRDRIRARFGATIKVNDTINAKIQLATSNDSRSTNQTLGEGWTRKPINIDQAYVDWKAFSFLNVQLGKMPMPWTKTASYFWDGDLSPEGAAVKFSKGTLFGSAAINWLNERHSNTATSARSDTRLLAGQFGIKQPIGKTTLTAAVGYFDVENIQNEIVATSTTPACTANAAFFQHTTGSGNANGNTTLTNGAGCTVLASDFTLINALAQLDFAIGSLPISLFVDYMQNQDAEVNAVAGKKLDTAMSYGVTFNKASAAKSWEAGVIYQQGEKDAVLGLFHDSDFGDGKTDSDGLVLKASYVPATNWTVSGTYFINKLNNDGVLATANTHDLDYKRLQLDLNFKF